MLPLRHWPGVFAHSDKRPYTIHRWLTAEVIPLDEALSRGFARRMTTDQQRLALYLLDLFTETVGPRYMLTYGNLLGAMLFKGFLPWDDDIDVFCLLDWYDEIKTACRQLGRLQWFDYNSPAALLFSKVCLVEGGLPIPGEPALTWPYIDIAWLKDVSRGVRMDTSNRFVYPVADLLPLGSIRFEGREYPCPQNPLGILERRYRFPYEYALPLPYDHMLGVSCPSQPLTLVPLEALTALYPVLKETLPQARGNPHASP